STSPRAPNASSTPPPNATPRSTGDLQRRRRRTTTSKARSTSPAGAGMGAPVTAQPAPPVSAGGPFGSMPASGAQRVVQVPATAAPGTPPPGSQSSPVSTTPSPQ